MQLLSRGDALFDDLHEQGLKRCAMNDNPLRKLRFFDLIQLFKQCLPLQGEVAECGSWRGLSSFLMCHYARAAEPSFKGNGHHIFDSFMGLPMPSAEDQVLEERVADVHGKFTGPLSEVKKALSEFPDVTYHAGWIPETLKDLPERKYRFVHVDLDLYRSTLDAARYFYPRLVPSGMLVCDDYASPGWPGAKQAIDEIVAEQAIRLLVLSTGQAVLKKP